MATKDTEKFFLDVHSDLVAGNHVCRDWRIHLVKLLLTIIDHYKSLLLTIINQNYYLIKLIVVVWGNMATEEVLKAERDPETGILQAWLWGGRALGERLPALDGL